VKLIGKKFVEIQGRVTLGGGRPRGKKKMGKGFLGTEKCEKKRVTKKKLEGGGENRE